MATQVSGYPIGCRRARDLTHSSNILPVAQSLGHAPLWKGVELVRGGREGSHLRQVWWLILGRAWVLASDLSSHPNLAKS